jgi:hypothetical protein
MVKTFCPKISSVNFTLLQRQRQERSLPFRDQFRDQNRLGNHMLLIR